MGNRRDLFKITKCSRGQILGQICSQACSLGYPAGPFPANLVSGRSHVDPVLTNGINETLVIMTHGFARPSPQKSSQQSSAFFPVS